jgi:Mor family transcriptional regulator
MRYRNASDIFPDKLLKEIQKYSTGELIYIPEKSEKKQWGERSGARDYYVKRNAEIRRKYREGKTIMELAEEYGLSRDTIRRILYR